MTHGENEPGRTWSAILATYAAAFGVAPLPAHFEGWISVSRASHREPPDPRGSC